MGRHARSSSSAAGRPLPGVASAGNAPPSKHADPSTGFAWLRLIGSLIVVIDHSRPLTDDARFEDPSAGIALTLFPNDWHLSPGYFALMGFFAMSGYQISESWRSDPSWWRFAAKRVLRVWPPLLVVLFATVLVIGPLVTTLSTRDYFAADGTWGYIVNNTGLYTLQHKLPGVFADNPYPYSANGSLWTLPMELTGYLVVLALGVFGLFTRARWVSVAILIGLVAFDRRFQATFGEPGDGGSFLSVPVGSLVAFMVAFMIGVVIYAYREEIPLSPLVASGLVAVQVAVHGTEIRDFTLPIMSGYGALVLAHHWPKRFSGYDNWVYGSYGLYIWAFPLQQVLIILGADTQLLLTITAMPAAYLFGLLSWKFVEQPTLGLRRYLRRTPPTKAPKPQPAADRKPPEPAADREPPRSGPPGPRPRPRPGGAPVPGPAGGPPSNGDAPARRPRPRPEPAPPPDSNGQNPSAAGTRRVTLRHGTVRQR